MTFSLKQLNRCDFFIFLVILYKLQGLLYEGGVVNVVLQAAMLIVAFIWSVKYIIPTKNTPGLLRATFLLLALFAVYGLYNIIAGADVRVEYHGVTPKYLYLQNSLNSLLPIFFFYGCARTGRLDIGRIKVYFFIFLALAIANYFKYEQQMLLNAMMRGSQQKEFTNNMGYAFLAVLPFISFFRRLFVRYALLAVCMAFIFMAMKRGAILIGVLCSLWMLFRDFKVMRYSWQRSLLIVSTLIVLWGG